MASAVELIRRQGLRSDGLGSRGWCRQLCRAGVGSVVDGSKGTVGIHQGVARTILPFLEGHAGRPLPVPIMEPVGPCP